MEQQSGLRELFFAIEENTKNVDGYHKKEADPKICFGKAGYDAGREIGENVARPELVWCCRTGENSSNRTYHLRGEESEGNMEASHCVKEDHAESCVDIN